MLMQRFSPEGASVLEIEHDPNLGYRLWAYGHGSHLVAPDGRHLASAPVSVPEWARMLLVAQVLPLVAALRGRVLLHASAVVLGGRVFGLTAASGTGKSSVATRLLTLGADFFADDVLALELDGGQVLAHPGPRFSGLHRHEFEALTPSQRSRLGRSLGESDKLHFEPAGASERLPLGGLVVLERAPADADAAIRPAETRFAELLATAYLWYLDEPEQLLRQFDVAAALTHTVPLVRVSIREGEGSASVAGRIAAWIETAG
jgi:hypothetical protein